MSGFKNIFWTVFENPFQSDGLESDVFINSDDKHLGNQIVKLFESLSFRFIYAGQIGENRTIERITLLSRNIAKREGFYPKFMDGF